MSKSYILTRREAFYELADLLESEELAERVINFFENNQIDIKNKISININGVNIKEMAKNITETVEDHLSIGYELRKEIEKELRSNLVE